MTKSKIRAAVSASIIRRADEDMDFVRPFDEPIHLQQEAQSLKKKTHLVDKNIDFLSKTEIKVLLLIRAKVVKNKNETEPVYLDHLHKELGNPISSLNKILQRLQKKGYIERVNYKPGVGGWTSYRVTHDAVKQIKEKDTLI